MKAPPAPPAGRLDPDQRHQPLQQPRRSGSSGETTASSFAAATSGESDSRIPASALTISPSAQNVIPSPYGRQRPCRQRISSGFVLEIGEQLGDQPALAHTRLADDRDQLHRALCADRSNVPTATASPTRGRPAASCTGG